MSSPTFWREAAPQGITGEDPWAVWSRHLGKRSKPQPLEKLGQAKSTPLTWGLTLQELSPRTVELLALLDQLGTRSGKDKLRVNQQTVEQVLDGWLEGSHALPQTIDFALECLAVAQRFTTNCWGCVARVLVGTG